MIHTVKGFGIVNKAEIDVFLELSSFFHDPADVGILISGSSAFSKTSLNIRKFTVHVLSKPGLENFEHYFTSMWDESCGHCWVFQICWRMECSTFTEPCFEKGSRSELLKSAPGKRQEPWTLTHREVAQPGSRPTFQGSVWGLLGSAPSFHYSLRMGMFSWPEWHPFTFAPES